jgi:hypothetical protein
MARELRIGEAGWRCKECDFQCTWDQEAMVHADGKTHILEWCGWEEKPTRRCSHSDFGVPYIEEIRYIRHKFTGRRKPTTFHIPNQSKYDPYGAGYYAADINAHLSYGLLEDQHKFDEGFRDRMGEKEL